jgi:ABC-type multidrug transport system permease subunit
LSDLVWRLGVTHRFGWRAYLREFPPSILLATSLPRVLLQIGFYVLLGGIVESQSYALIGAAAATMGLFTAVNVSEVPAVDLREATLFRYRLGVVSPLLSQLIRAIPYAATGLASAMIGIAVVGPLTGHASLSAHLIPAIPLYAVMALTSSLAGLAIGILSTPTDNDLIAGNLLLYAQLLLSGAIIPAERLGPAAWLGEILPLRHGLSGVRALVDGRPWLTETLLEAAVGIGWAAVCWALVRRHLRRARTRGAADV